MPSGGLSYQVTQSDDKAVLRLNGEVDLATGEDFETQLRTALRSAGRSLVVDMSKVTFLGSAGLATLIAVNQDAGRQGIELTLICGPATRRTIEIVGLSEQLNVQ